MNMTARTLAVTAASVLLLGCAHTDKAEQQAQAKAPLYSCYRHITNNSSCNWTFQIESHYPQHGNVYFGNSNTSSCTQRNGPCTVAPGTTIDLHYTYTDGASDGQMNITDSTGKTNAWIYGNDVVNQCVSFNHSGNTGSVALNDPSGGDMNAWGPCNW
ncbi:hypothetical protein DW355_17480 [Hylemonella gracilis]|jgi:hypothetical protein|uniref:Lipoprotein n=2 Tax=Hylemonella gracilis TaxID=80880 RepID=A0A4P6UNQ1_9BURK|nr:hypothetical protein DW355_17480 [Hylemonella gracilis]